jgi:hypothetical protein
MDTKKTTAIVAKTSVKKPAVVKKAVAPLVVSKPSESAARKQTTKKPKGERPKKKRKEKVIRDSFAMPQSEYLKIFEIKETCLTTGLSVKKSEVLRAGLKILGEMNATKLKQTLAGLGKTK